MFTMSAPASCVAHEVAELGSGVHTAHIMQLPCLWVGRE